MVGAATAKLREPKHVRTCWTATKLQSDERSLPEIYGILRQIQACAHLLLASTVVTP